MKATEEMNELLDRAGIHNERAVAGGLMAPLLVAVFKNLLERIEALEKCK